MQSLLNGQVAIITGAGRGIGRAIALAFAKEGARLFLAARTESELAETVTACEGTDGTAHVVVTDVSKWNEVEKLAITAIQQAGRVDVLVNAAGVYGPIGPTADIDISAWTQAAEVNLFGPFYPVRNNAPLLLAPLDAKLSNGVNRGYVLIKFRRGLMSRWNF